MYKFSADKPIEFAGEDLLGRDSFSKNLGRAIYKCDAKDGFVIGIYGEWGSGKTSIINMAIHTVGEISKGERNGPIIIKFSPWNYSEQSNLISTFFKSLQNEIKMNEDKKFREKMGKALRDYAGAFDALSVIPVLGPGFAALFKALAMAKGNDLMQEVNLDETRTVLEKCLIESGRKIIVIIDDIDRLTNIQIREVFQLVKQVADFPNIIYLLAMDRKIVCRALKEVHNIEGNEYLEKIIQVSFEIPMLQKAQINEILLNKLGEIDPGLICCDDETDYFGDVRHDCIDPYINTVRDINKVVNTFHFRYGYLCKETNFVDLLAITTLEVMEPELYKWIYRNKETVCSGMPYGGIYRSSTDLEKHCRREFENIGVNPETTIRCLSTMFPAFEAAINCTSDGDVYFNDYIRGRQRIAHWEKFEIYFVFNLSKIQVTRAELDSFINRLEGAALWEAVKEIYLRGDIDCFFDELKPLVDDIPEQRLNLIASVLLRLLRKIVKDSDRVESIEIHSKKTGSIFLEVLKRVDCEEDRIRIVLSEIELFDIYNFGVLYAVIDEMVTVEEGFRNMEPFINKSDIVMNQEHLDIIKKKYIKKLEEWSVSEELLKMNMFGEAYYLWKRIDKESAETHVRKLLKDNRVNSLRFICATAGEWSGTNGGGWWFKQENYSELISPQLVYDYIKELDKNQMTMFSRTELMKLASFYLSYNRDKMYRADKHVASKLVDEWLDYQQ